MAEEPPSAWSLAYEEFDPAQEGMREALCALGNGYFTTRGAAAGRGRTDVHYPGTYLAGGYNRLRTDIAGRTVENEDLVNFPNWLALGFRIGDGDWFDAEDGHDPVVPPGARSPARHAAADHTLRGRPGAAQHPRGAAPRLHGRHAPRSALELSLTAENWSGPVTVRSAIDGRVVNAGAKLYRKFNNRHLEPLAGEVVGEDGVCLLVRTCQSNLHVAQAARTRAFLDGERRRSPRRLIEEPGYIGQEFGVELKEGQTLVLEKLSFLYTSRDHAISESGRCRPQGDRAGRSLRSGDGGRMSSPGSTCGAASTCTSSPPDGGTSR